MQTKIVVQYDPRLMSELSLKFPGRSRPAFRIVAVMRERSPVASVVRFVMWPFGLLMMFAPPFFLSSAPWVMSCCLGALLLWIALWLLIVHFEDKAKALKLCMYDQRLVAEVRKFLFDRR